MTNLLQQAINCDDADRAARIIQDALGIESDDVVNYSRKAGPSTTSSVRPSSVSGSKPKHVILLRERTPPLPTPVEELAEYFIVRDANGQALAVYFEEEPGRRAAAKLLTRDEARRIAANIAKLPDLLRGPPPTSEA